MDLGIAGKECPINVSVKSSGRVYHSVSIWVVVIFDRAVLSSCPVRCEGFVGSEGDGISGVGGDDQPLVD